MPGKGMDLRRLHLGDDGLEGMGTRQKLEKFNQADWGADKKRMFYLGCISFAGGHLGEIMLKFFICNIRLTAQGGVIFFMTLILK